MTKTGSVVALIATVVSIQLSGCKAMEEIGGGMRAVEPRPVEPIRPGIDHSPVGLDHPPGGVEPVVPVEPPREKLADDKLPAMKSVAPSYKKRVLDAACTANDIYAFATASSDDERVEILQNQGTSPAALVSKIVDVSDQLRELNDNPQWDNGIEVTAATICFAKDLVG
jgi:hypothetical protein